MDPEQQRFRDAVSDELRAARARQRLSQGEVSDRSGESPSTIYRIESGKRAADVDQLFAICKVLGVRPGDVLNAAQDRNQEE
ncbi:helix-turn-helix transcriptional regulator [Rhodococcus ruber]|uniref:helix-turn-helix domain-containing protein n=1 Tax=Rhodococcus TaxID=1827 RepID=UPI001934862C|nr:MULTISPECIES: helix-turn-helix transcriptional regulator [Rhodococcus]MCD2127727.1 helix-turn-helix domain-containing protein [Rhodococcus ruber]MCZ1071689.1 helix-turn-helix transcriptional regulator [Rhodococcus sp. A5(2022)]MCZ4504385.1 helix-turn-helix transcriptional regulator [Rhodococcus ruber]MCZ4529379.1 helix-turn-helix transcriptional regulator [Rhodococcus ruber]MCZ4621046.1 helix-turn-helix transcriptional regulator [Rhodococcus ruber]